MYTINKSTVELPEFKIHPAAEKLPMMEPEKLEVLKADILLNGMYNPIWIIDNQILDGRARYAALKMLVQSNQLYFEPQFKEWSNDASEIDDVVRSLNVHRNHYTKHQLAAYAVIHLLPELKNQATDRMYRKVPLENIPEAQKGNANYLAARQVGTNEKYVQFASQINEYSSIYLKYVLNSTMKLQEGIQLIAMDMEKQKFYDEYLREGKDYKVAEKAYIKLHVNSNSTKTIIEPNVMDEGDIDSAEKVASKPKSSRKESQTASKIVRLEHLEFSQDKLSSGQPDVGIIFPRPIKEEVLDKIVQILEQNQFAETPYTIWVTNKSVEMQETMEKLYDPAAVIAYEVNPFPLPIPIDQVKENGTL